MMLLEKLKNEILPKTVEEGRFGKDKVKLIDYQTDNEFTALDQFSSCIQFGDVILETDTGERFIQSIVIKTQTEVLEQQASQSPATGLPIQLYNELIFYTEVLPLLTECESDATVTKIFPKCFYGSVVRGGDPADDILIFENVQKRGFKLSASKTFIDYDHVMLSMNWIAKFHALSLVCKRKFADRFEKVVSTIMEPQWTEETVITRWNKFFVENCRRGVSPLQKDPSYKDKLKDLLEVVEETNLSMAKLVTPVEPLAVICHGDFCRNNIFYKYDSHGVPCQVMFFDMGTIRYSSPVIDLSFFLFMNSSQELRSTHWDEIVRTYHSALVSNSAIAPENLPSLGDVRKDFQRRGFYGYVHASYYLPMMLTDREGEVEWWKLSFEDHLKVRLSTGGEEATTLVAKIVKHMIDKKFDFQYIKNFELKYLKKLAE